MKWYSLLSSIVRQPGCRESPLTERGWRGNLSKLKQRPANWRPRFVQGMSTGLKLHFGLPPPLARDATQHTATNVCRRYDKEDRARNALSRRSENTSLELFMRFVVRRLLYRMKNRLPPLGFGAAAAAPG